MSDLPRQRVEPVQDVISTFSPACINRVGGGVYSWVLSAASGAGSGNNTSYYFPFVISEPIVAKILWTRNGTASAGNIDVGIYDIHGNKLVSSGSTASAGTSQYQNYNIADTPVPPGLNYLAIAWDNASMAFMRSTLNAGTLATFGCKQESTYPLPATATLNNSTASYIPLFGLSQRTSI